MIEEVFQNRPLVSHAPHTHARTHTRTHTYFILYKILM